MDSSTGHSYGCADQRLVGSRTRPGRRFVAELQLVLRDVPSGQIARLRESSSQRSGWALDRLLSLSAGPAGRPVDAQDRLSKRGSISENLEVVIPRRVDPERRAADDGH